VKRHKRVRRATLTSAVPLIDTQQPLERNRAQSEDDLSFGAQTLIAERMDDPFMALIEQDRVDSFNEHLDDAPRSIITPQSSITNVRPVAIRTKLDWFPQIRYIVYHPVSYTLVATFFLLMIKVSSSAVSRLLFCRDPPAFKGLL